MFAFSTDQMEKVYGKIINNEHFDHYSSYQGSINNYTITVGFGESVLCKDGYEHALYLDLPGTYHKEVTYKAFSDLELELTPDWFQELFHEAKKINEKHFRLRRLVNSK